MSTLIIGWFYFNRKEKNERFFTQHFFTTVTVFHFRFFQTLTFFRWTRRRSPAASRSPSAAASSAPTRVRKNSTETRQRTGIVRAAQEPLTPTTTSETTPTRGKVLRLGHSPPVSWREIIVLKSSAHGQWRDGNAWGPLPWEGSPTLILKLYLSYWRLKPKYSKKLTNIYLRELWRFPYFKDNIELNMRHLLLFNIES